MTVWAAVMTFVFGTLAYLAGDSSALLMGAAELTAVIGLFALVCAAEALN
ncbi:MAG TPA: hypothetical protein VIL09_11490 [Microvirga sp.]|jgi:hypothetical protein